MTARDLADMLYRYPLDHPARPDLERLVTAIHDLRGVLRQIQRDTREAQTYASCQQALEET